MILEYNYFSRFGEIDIIAKYEGYICFIEVKYRKNNNYGDAGESINQTKKNRIMKTAKYYILKNDLNESSLYRFDVVLIENSKIKVIKNAFGGF